MVEAYWVYGLCVDQHAIQIRTHVFWQPGLRTTEREGAFVWLELVCCPKPSAALSVIICSENNSSFLGADSQSWFESSPACLGTLRFVLSIYGFVRRCPLHKWICYLLSLDFCSPSMDLCVVLLWICSLLCALLCLGFVLYINGFVICFIICALLQCCFVSLCSHSMEMCFWLFSFSHLCTEWTSTTDAVCFQTVLMRWWR